MSPYQIPNILHEQHLDDLICERFGIQTGEADLSDWQAFTQALLNTEHSVTVAMVGKYVEL